MVAHVVTDAAGLHPDPGVAQRRGPDHRDRPRRRARRAFDYDEACQLVEARSGTVTRWRFDAAGRLVAESRDGDAVEHAYDAAGQLVTSRRADGSSTRHSYDPVGRRVRTEDSDGRRPRLRLVGRRAG